MAKDDDILECEDFRNVPKWTVRAAVGAFSRRDVARTMQAKPAPADIPDARTLSAREYADLKDTLTGGTRAGRKFEHPEPAAGQPEPGIAGGVRFGRSYDIGEYYRLRRGSP